MASIRKRVRADGTIAYAVLYKLGQSQTAATFGDETSAEEFRNTVDNIGAERAMRAWGIGQSTRVQRPKGPPVSEWLEHYVAHLTGVAKSTIYDYKSYAKNDIGPAFGSLPLPLLSSDEIDAWVNAMAANGSAGKTIANKHGFLSAALNAAVKAKLIPSNPAAGTRIPRTEKTDMVFLSKQDYARLLAEVPDRWKPLVEFLVTSGARWGEVTALKPADINRTQNTVRITKAWKRTYAKGGYEIGPPKTKKSVRTIKVPKRVLDQLDYSGDWLFVNPGVGERAKGDAVRVANFRANVWWPACARAKLDPRPRIHDLRHTCASWLIARDIPLSVVSRHFGHETISVTVDIYGHLDMRSAQAVADALDTFLE